VLLLVFVLAIGAVSASNSFDDVLNDLGSFADLNVEYLDEDANVTVGDYNFTIPEGFGLIEQLAVDTKENNESETVNFFTNDKDEVIMVSITSSDYVNDTVYTYISNSTPYENVTINGHDGAKWNDKSLAFFSYVEDNDIIVLQAPDETYFEKMVI
jgi:hypothetical protein